MAITVVSAPTASQTKGTASGNVNVTGPSPGIVIPGDIILAYVAFDNLTATTPIVNSLSKQNFTPYFESNDWSKIASFDSPQSAAAAGVRGEVWMIVASVPWNNATVTSIGITGAIAARVGGTTVIRGANPTPTFAQSAPSANITKTTTPGNYYLHFVGSESNSAPSAIPNSSNGQSAVVSVATTGGGAAANVAFGLTSGVGSTLHVSTQWQTALTDGGHIVVEFEPAPGIPPATTLNIGSAVGQNHFAVRIAPTDGSAWFQKTQAEIEAGYQDPVHFATEDFSGTNRVVFQPSAIGAVENAGPWYARDELIEVNADGSPMGFNAMVGEHIMSGISDLVDYPYQTDGDVLVAHLANSDGDSRIGIGSQELIDYEVRIGIYRDGNVFQGTILQAGYLSGEFQWKIRIIDGVAEIYYTNMATPKYSVALTAPSVANSWFFRTGALAGFKSGISGPGGDFVAATEFAKVSLRNLSVSHVAGTGGGTDTQKIAIGSSLVGMDKLYIGSQKVNRVYVGSTMVYDDV